MTSVSARTAARLDLLVANGVIAGWQDAGGPNYGLDTEPLPALIFPIDGRHAATFYNDHDLALAVSALEQFGPIAGLSNR